MMLRMTLVVLLPVLVGQGARRLLWHRAGPRSTAVLRGVPRLTMLFFVYIGFSAAAGDLWREPALAFKFLGVCASLHLLLLVWTGWSSRLVGLEPATRTAVILCGAQKTLPNGIYLWDRFFAANPYGAVPLALYHVFQLVADTLLVPWLPSARRLEKARNSSEPLNPS